MVKHSRELFHANIHCVTQGEGRPILLLHGWPEIGRTWRPVMERLADRYVVYAPDLLGFGKSGTSPSVCGPDQQADALIEFVSKLGVGPIGVVAHDIGGAVAQALVRKAPDLVSGLFFFNFIYPGVGDRFLASERMSRAWYFFFHMTDLPGLSVGASPVSARRYISYFLEHWSINKHAFDGDLEEILASYERPGALADSLAHYRAVGAQRTDAKDPRSDPPPITHPTCVRWATDDTLFDYSWTDRLPEFFSNLELGKFTGVGHFPHREDPETASREIASFFGALNEKAWHS